MLTETRVALPGGRTATVYTAGDGPPLVWCHSLYGVDADAPLVERLAATHTVYAPLAPGFTDLADLDELRDIHDLALHYDDILTGLGLTYTTVAGHSFGAMIAAELAAHYPDKIKKLVLLSSLGLWSDDHPIPDLFGIPQAEAPSLLYTNPPKPPATQQDIETTLALVRGMTTVARFLWPIPDRGLSRRLRRITAPTLVIHGENDRFVPVEYADDFVKLIPNANKYIVKSAAHMLTVEALDAIVPIMLDFVTERERSIV